MDLYLDKTTGLIYQYAPGARNVPAGFSKMDPLEIGKGQEPKAKKAPAPKNKARTAPTK